MAANRDSEAILDIADAAQQIQSAMQSVTLDQFKRTREKQAAILYFCIIIGKATKRISSELKSQYPDVPWREMAGLRDILAHQYDRVDTETIWDMTQTNIPELFSHLQPILKTFESDPLVFVIKSINWLQVFPAVFTRKTIVIHGEVRRPPFSRRAMAEGRSQYVAWFRWGDRSSAAVP
jgi:uncharacterized protein with HEPN domain